MIQMIFNGQTTAFVLVLIALIFSLSFHEFGHAFAAKLYGDDTAQKLGRLTVNPIAHIDLMGLLMVILVGFGYAKPVPTDPRNYRSIWGQLVVAAAGPLANLIIAIVVLNLWQFGIKSGWESFATQGTAYAVSIVVIVNLILMVFNLIPIGPLDGHYILPYFLPRRLAMLYREYNARFGYYLLLGVILLSIAGVPIFRFVQQLGLSLIPYITFV